VPAFYHAARPNKFSGEDSQTERNDDERWAGQDDQRHSNEENSGANERDQDFANGRSSTQSSALEGPFNPLHRANMPAASARAIR
jgi:hypothetical protein